MRTMNKIRNDTKRHMRTLGTYRKEFDEIIIIYSKMLYEFELRYENYEQNGFITTINYINGNGKEASATNPEIRIMECLRKDIKAYSDMLGLNPKSAPYVEDEAPVVNKLELIMQKQRTAAI